MFKQKIKSLQFWLIAASITLYVSCLFFTPFYVANKEADVYSNSLFMLLFGWVAILGGGLAPTIIWLANPLYFAGLFFILNRVKFGVVAITLALVLALYFTTLDSIVDGESGKTTDITALGVGFYLWISSLMMLFFAGIYMLISKKMGKEFN